MVLFCLLLAGLPAQALTTGSSAPLFKLPTVTGEQVSLADFRGKPVLLKIGTTWCPACQQLDTELDKAAPALKTAGITVISVFIDESAQAVQTYQKEQGLRTSAITVLGDQTLVRNYGIYLIPRLLLLDTNLKIIHDGSMLSAEELRKLATTAHTDIKTQHDNH